MKLGIDIGGTNICLGVVDGNRVVELNRVRSFDKSWSQKQTIDYLSEQIESFSPSSLQSIGIGVPSVVDLKRGVVFNAANIPSWDEIPLAEILEKRFGIPVKINNDANCYALGAYASFDASERPDSLVAVTLGTGVGMGIVHDGILFCGANCGAGELCSLPFKGSTLEDHCAKSFFLSRGISPRENQDRAVQGDPEALSMYEEFGRNLGYALYAVLLAYDPSCVVIGGGIANGIRFFRPAMEAYLRESFPYPCIVEKLRIEALSDENIPVLGAASL